VLILATSRQDSESIRIAQAKVIAENKALLAQEAEQLPEGRGMVISTPLVSVQGEPLSDNRPVANIDDFSR
jgi:hypothetical protein